MLQGPTEHNNWPELLQRALQYADVRRTNDLARDQKKSLYRGVYRITVPKLIDDAVQLHFVPTITRATFAMGLEAWHNSGIDERADQAAFLVGGISVVQLVEEAADLNKDAQERAIDELCKNVDRDAYARRRPLPDKRQTIEGACVHWLIELAYRLRGRNAVDPEVFGLHCSVAIGDAFKRMSEAHQRFVEELSRKQSLSPDYPNAAVEYLSRRPPNDKTADDQATKKKPKADPILSARASPRRIRALEPSQVIEHAREMPGNRRSGRVRDQDRIRLGRSEQE